MSKNIIGAVRVRSLLTLLYITALVLTLLATPSLSFHTTKQGNFIRSRIMHSEVSRGSISPRSPMRMTGEHYSKEQIERIWETHFSQISDTKYQLITTPGMEKLGESIANMYPHRFMLQKTSWGKFPDGTDNIEIGGFHPVNHISGENVLMLCSFHNNDVTLSQFSVMVTLLQSFISSLTVVLPFYPVGTMERVIKEGQVATGAC